MKASTMIAIIGVLIWSGAPTARGADPELERVLASCQEAWAARSPISFADLAQHESGVDGREVNSARCRIWTDASGADLILESDGQTSFLRASGGDFVLSTAHQAYRFGIDILNKGNLNFPAPSAGAFFGPGEIASEYMPTEGGLLTAGPYLVLWQLDPGRMLKQLAPSRLILLPETRSIEGRVCRTISFIPAWQQSSVLEPQDIVSGLPPRLDIAIDISSKAIVAIEGHVDRLTAQGYRVVPWFSWSATSKDLKQSVANRIDVVYTYSDLPQNATTLVYMIQAASGASSRTSEAIPYPAVVMDLPFRPASEYSRLNEADPANWDSRVNRVLALAASGRTLKEATTEAEQLLAVHPTGEAAVSGLCIVAEAIHQALPSLSMQLAQAALLDLDSVADHKNRLWWEQRLRIIDARCAVVTQSNIRVAQGHMARLAEIAQELPVPYAGRQIQEVVRRLGLWACETRTVGNTPSPQPIPGEDVLSSGTLVAVDLLTPEIEEFRRRAAQAQTSRQRAAAYRNLVAVYEEYARVLRAEGRLDQLDQFLERDSQSTYPLAQADLLKEKVRSMIARVDQHKQGNRTALAEELFSLELNSLVSRGSGAGAEITSAALGELARGLLVLPAGPTSRKPEWAARIVGACTKPEDVAVATAIQALCYSDVGLFDAAQHAALAAAQQLRAKPELLGGEVQRECLFYLGEYGKHRLLRDDSALEQISPGNGDNAELLLLEATMRQTVATTDRWDLVERMLNRYEFLGADPVIGVLCVAEATKPASTEGGVMASTPPVIERLQQLLSHANPAVRTEIFLTLADWYGMSSPSQAVGICQSAMTQIGAPDEQMRIQAAQFTWEGRERDYQDMDAVARYCIQTIQSNGSDDAIREAAQRLADLCVAWRTLAPSGEPSWLGEGRLAVARVLGSYAGYRAVNLMGYQWVGNDNSNRLMLLAQDAEQRGAIDEAIAWTRLAVGDIAQVGAAGEQAEAVAAILRKYSMPAAEELWWRHITSPEKTADPTTPSLTAAFGFAPDISAGISLPDLSVRYVALGTFYTRDRQFELALDAFNKAFATSGSDDQRAEALGGLAIAKSGQAYLLTARQADSADAMLQEVVALATQAVELAPAPQARALIERTVSGVRVVANPQAALSVVEGILAKVEYSSPMEVVAQAKLVRAWALSWNRRHSEAISSLRALADEYATASSRSIQDVCVDALCHSYAYSNIYKHDPAGGAHDLARIQAMFPDGRYTKTTEFFVNKVKNRSSCMSEK